MLKTLLILLLILPIWLWYKGRKKYRICLQCPECGHLIPTRERQIDGDTYEGYMPKTCPNCGSVRYNHKRKTYNYPYVSGKSNFKLYNPLTWFKNEYELIEKAEFEDED